MLANTSAIQHQPDEKLSQSHSTHFDGLWNKLNVVSSSLLSSRGMLEIIALVEATFERSCKFSLLACAKDTCDSTWGVGMVVNINS